MAINRATWAVYGELKTADGNTKHYPIGTAWAVDRRLLVSNAHVTQAFEDFAKQGVQLERAIGIQAGTGEVVELLREITHPDYKDPLKTPDVGLFTTRDELGDVLELAPTNVELALGDELQIVGFPGDVTMSIEIVPGETVPQATSLTGRITALRSHDDATTVTWENADVIQHQAPTTAGNSGSSVVLCGRVVGVHNAGTQRLVATPNGDGTVSFTVQSAAANNFAVHVRHIHDLLQLFDDDALQGRELPVMASGGGTAGSSGGAGAGGVMGGAGGDAGTGGVMGGTGGTGTGSAVAVFNGQVGDPAPHTFQIRIESGVVSGTADWGGTRFSLAGQVFADGEVYFEDNAPELTGDVRGLYSGALSGTIIQGYYTEEGAEGVVPFQAVAQ